MISIQICGHSEIKGKTHSRRASPRRLLSESAKLTRKRLIWTIFFNPDNSGDDPDEEAPVVGFEEDPEALESSGGT